MCPAAVSTVAAPASPGRGLNIGNLPTLPVHSRSRAPRPLQQQCGDGMERETAPFQQPASVQMPCPLTLSTCQSRVCLRLGDASMPPLSCQDYGGGAAAHEDAKGQGEGKTADAKASSPRSPTRSAALDRMPSDPTWTQIDFKEIELGACVCLPLLAVFVHCHACQASLSPRRRRPLGPPGLN